MKYDISIIIVNYNTPELLENCVRSIQSMNIISSYEVVVVDNGSGDRSIRVIKELKKEGLIDRTIFNQDNLGFSKANNQGIDVSKCKYKLLLNSDTMVKKNSIDELVKFANKTKDCGVVGSKLLNKDGSIQPSCFNFPTVWRAIKQYWLKKGKPLDKFAPQGYESCMVNAIVGASFLITPKAVEKVGLLDERYFMYFEDLDYCRRTWNAGLKVYYLPSSEIIHLHGQSGKKERASKDQWKRLIPSSKLYHGTLKHYLFNFVLWSSQKLGIA